MFKKIVLIASLFSCINTQLWATNEEGVNHMELATMMYYDGKYTKALHELQLAEESHMKMDWSQFHSIKGLIHLENEEYPQAIRYLNKAISATRTKVYVIDKAEEQKEKREYLFSFYSEKKEPKAAKKKEPAIDYEKIRQDKIEELYIYLSKAYYKSKQYIYTVNALDNAGQRGRDNPGYFTLRAECYWKDDQKYNAITTLSKGAALFPKDATLLKQKFYYFAELKLYQASISAAKAYMKRIPASDQEYISLSQMLLSAGENSEALKVLEEARLRFPTSAKIYILLGHLYNKKDMPHTTAHLFEQGSYYDKAYLKEASEMYRRAGNLSYALYLNSMLKDKKEKTKQKVAIYVDRSEFEKVIGLKDALNRYGLLKDDNMRYALAYAYYVVKDYESAEFHLKKIQDDELFSKATVIRKNIEKCQDNSLECI